MVLFDTNAILRYLLQDNREMADSVESRLAAEACYLPVEVVAEVVYVLSGVYRVERKMIARTLSALAALEHMHLAHDGVVHHALGAYAASTLDFVDCLLAGYAKVEDYEVVTFDKKLLKLLTREK